MMRCERPGVRNANQSTDISQRTSLASPCPISGEPPHPPPNLPRRIQRRHRSVHDTTQQDGLDREPAPQDCRVWFGGLWGESVCAARRAALVEGARIGGGGNGGGKREWEWESSWRGRAGVEWSWGEDGRAWEWSAGPGRTEKKCRGGGSERRPGSRWEAPLTPGLRPRRHRAELHGQAAAPARGASARASQLLIHAHAPGFSMLERGR